VAHYVCHYQQTRRALTHDMAGQSHPPSERNPIPGTQSRISHQNSSNK
jgi:hypothetical protein